MNSEDVKRELDRKIDFFLGENSFSRSKWQAMTLAATGLAIFIGATVAMWFYQSN